VTDHCYYCDAVITQGNWAGEFETGSPSYDGVSISDDIHTEYYCVNCVGYVEAA